MQNALRALSSAGWVIATVLGCGGEPATDLDAAPSMPDAQLLDAQPLDAGGVAEPPVVGATRCEDAPTIDAPALVRLSSATEAVYLRVRVPPRAAIGLHREEGGSNRSFVSCARCDAFDSFGGSCDAPPPGQGRPNAHPLLVNEGDSPLEVLVSALPEGDFPGVDRVRLHRFGLERVAPAEPCEATQLQDGVAALGLRCGATVVVPPDHHALVFGETPELLTNTSGTSSELRTASASAGRAAVLVPSAGVRCQAPLALESGRTVVLRADLGAASPDFEGPCTPLDGAFPRGSSGVRYVSFEVPAGGRAELFAESRMIADGGGHAALRLARGCDRALTCEAEVAQAWMSSAPPASLVVDNPSDTSRFALVSVEQAFIGYWGNQIRVRLETSPR